LGCLFCNLTNGESLESLLQPDVPEPAFDVSNRLIVAVLEAAGYKRRFFVGHVLHAGVTVVLLSHHFQLLQPYSAVDTGTTFFSLPFFPLHVFPAILGKARHLDCCGRLQLGHRMLDRKLARDCLSVPVNAVARTLFSLA
jgi:hypothetical protein